MEKKKKLGERRAVRKVGNPYGSSSWGARMKGTKCLCLSYAVYCRSLIDIFPPAKAVPLCNLIAVTLASLYCLFGWSLPFIPKIVTNSVLIYSSTMFRNGLLRCHLELEFYAPT